MRSLFVAVFFLCVPLAVQAETLQEWVKTAPPSNIVFTPWDGDLLDANNNREGYMVLPQGFYGYLDLSNLPADAFPIKVRILYDNPTPGDWVINSPGKLSQMKASYPVGENTVVDETTLRTPADARAVGVWNTPVLFGGESGYNGLEEFVRVEVRSNSGSLIGRLPIGASTSPWSYPRAVLVNAPDFNEAFTRAGYRTLANVKRLVPNSYGLINVDTIWIDGPTANDPSLTDAFWQQVLLNGTTVAGHPDDIAIVAKRLNLTLNEPGVLGKLVAADSPAAFLDNQGGLRPAATIPVQIYGEGNPFASSNKTGEVMHRQLLRFSAGYLGIFFVLQALVIIAAFVRLRGPQRVWLWLYVPLFALAFTVVGILSAHVFCQARLDERLTQVEFMYEGWPQALLLSHLEEIRLAGRETVVELPSESRPFAIRSDYTPWNSFATFSFDQDWDGARLTMHARPATRAMANVRSLLPPSPPCEVTPDGSVRAESNFSGSWLWDGENWHNLGPLQNGQVVDWKTAPIIHPTPWTRGRVYRDGSSDENFPSALKPLLVSDSHNALSSTGDGVFLGSEPGADVLFEDAKADHLVSRRVVAYQFHLKGGTP